MKTCDQVHQSADSLSFFVGSPELVHELELRRMRLEQALQRLDEKRIPHGTEDFKRVPYRDVPRLRDLVIQETLDKAQRRVQLETELRLIIHQINALQTHIHSSCQAIFFKAEIVQGASSPQTHQREQEYAKHRKSHQKKRKFPEVLKQDSDPTFFLRLHPDIADLFHIENPYHSSLESTAFPVQEAQKDFPVVGGVDDVSMKGVMPVGTFTVMKKK